MSDFAEYLRTEARRIKAAREASHAGTRNRHDLIFWADALQWAANKYDHGKAAGRWGVDGD